MNIEYVSVLQIHRDLQELPRNSDRFHKYLEVIGCDNGEASILRLPSLLIANPMGKEHVTSHLDELIAMGADATAAQAVQEAAKSLADEPGQFKLALVLADDLLGGWTNRYADEYTLRFPSPVTSAGTGELPSWLIDFWLTALLWTSEKPSLQRVREAVLMPIYRMVYFQRHGFPSTLNEMLIQEGTVMAQAGCTEPIMDEEEIEYTREVIAPHLDSTDKRTIMECLFGDAAGKTLGFTPQGLGHWAGLAVALHDGRQRVASDTN